LTETEVSVPALTKFRSSDVAGARVPVEVTVVWTEPSEADTKRVVDWDDDPLDGAIDP
jgi:hypothetical protein